MWLSGDGNVCCCDRFWLFIAVVISGAVVVVLDVAVLIMVDVTVWHTGTSGISEGNEEELLIDIQHTEVFLSLKLLVMLLLVLVFLLWLMLLSGFRVHSTFQRATNKNY